MLKRYNPNGIDYELLTKMDFVRKIVSMGLSLRRQNNIKVRQPLSSISIYIPNMKKSCLDSLMEHILEELNVKSVEIIEDISEFAKILIKPNFKSIGAAYGSLSKDIFKSLSSISPEHVLQEIFENGSVSIPVNDTTIEIERDDIFISFEPNPGVKSQFENDIFIMMDFTITDDLKIEGEIKDIIREIQSIRKELKISYDARIKLFVCANKTMKNNIVEWENTIKGTTLTDEIEFCEESDENFKKIEFDNDSEKTVFVKVVI